MDCPNCGFEAKRETFKGVDIRRCLECHGVWLSAPYLDRFEDRDFSVTEIEGATLHEAEQSDMLCPECREQMQKFHFSAYAMVIDFCPKHGYWIGRDEEKRVMRLMERESRALMNNLGAEQRWANALIKLRSPAFWGRLNLL